MSSIFPDFRYLRDSAAEWFLFPFAVTVTANASSQIIQVPVGNAYHFFSAFLTVAYTTIFDEGAGSTDDGVCRISVQIRDQSRQRALMNDFTRLDVLSTPGRVRAPGATGDAPNAINIPGMPFPYLFEADSNIEIEFRSTSNEDNTVRGAFHGLKYPTRVYPKDPGKRAAGVLDAPPAGI